LSGIALLVADLGADMIGGVIGLVAACVAVMQARGRSVGA
jgi:hypothetical protein